MVSPRPEGANEKGMRHVPTFSIIHCTEPHSSKRATVGAVKSSMDSMA